MSLKNLCFLVLVFTSFILTGCDHPSSVKQIGIIVPIEHQALNEIVSGFTETLDKTYPGKIKFKIANAQGDLNLLRAITQQMKDKQMDLIVPVTTSPTEMAAAMITKTPLLSLASVYTQKERQKRKVCNITVVHDQIPIAKHIEFIHAIYPDLHHIALIHSPDDKIYSEVQAIVAYAKKYKIVIKPYMINNLSEIYSTAQNIAQQTQAIIILKDSLIASGVGTLVKAAAQRHIPLITSDQGTVQNGASFALGVPEREIGVQGAMLATKILNGQSPCEMPMEEMKKFTIFINEKANTADTISLLKQAAQKNNYAVEVNNG